MLSIRFYIKLILVVLAVTVIVGYTLLEARSLFERNNLVIENPANGAMLEREMTNIEGRARNVASISVNGLSVFVDEDGYFAVPYLAAPGYNIVQVALRDKFGRVEKKTVQFVYKK